MNDERIVTVFGSSRPGEGEADYAEARELGRGWQSGASRCAAAVMAA